MSDETRNPDDPTAAAEAADDRRDRVSTPFEKPFFMPILLFVLAIWFGYDGWFNEEIKSILFNRVVFGVLIVLTVYTTWQDIRVVRKPKE